jgi:hypothetical protein
MKAALPLAGLALLLSFGAAPAQYLPNYSATPPQSSGYVIQRPGEAPSYVNPNGSGGYTVQTPGRPPNYIVPNGAGGYIVQTPGQSPTYINPR